MIKNKNMISVWIIIGLFLSTANFVASAQVKIGANPTQLVSGALFQIDGNNTTTIPAKLIVTGNGNVGIGTAAPTNTLHISSTANPLRIQGLAQGTGSENQLLIDGSGVVKMSSQSAYSLFYARLKADQSLVPSPITLVYDAPLANSSLYTYDTTNGRMTFNQPGNYLVTMQAGFTNTTVGKQLILGIRPFPDAPYLGRGSHYSATELNGTTGELMQYTTLIQVPTAGYQVVFIATCQGTATVLKDESGSTGSGNVTNITVQKI